MYSGGIMARKRTNDFFASLRDGLATVALFLVFVSYPFLRSQVVAQVPKIFGYHNTSPIVYREVYRKSFAPSSCLNGQVGK
jgi:phospholipase/lecithinase/hemolysin